MQMIFSGIGGQGILLATRVIGEYALSKGLSVIGSEVHGMAQRGGSVVSHLKIGNYNSPLVMRGEADLLIAFDWHEGLRNLPFLKEEGIALLNSDKHSKVEHPTIESFIRKKRLEVYAVDGYKVALDQLKSPGVLNVVMLGKLSYLMEERFPPEELKNIIEKIVSPKFKEINLTAFDLGRKMEIREVI